MGTLIRLLLRALGVKMHERKYLSEVSKTIELLPGGKRTRWIWGGLIHLVPVIAVLIWLFTVRLSEVNQTESQIVALFIACSWVALGPILIWYYERFALPRFCKECRAVITDGKQFSAIRNNVYSNVLRFRFCQVFMPVWILIILYAFFRSQDLLSSFAVRGICDPIWWLITLGVVLFGFYTSLGFCLEYKALKLSYLVAGAKLKDTIYHEDNILGLSFVGDFAFKTMGMFLSGWLFAPFLILSFRQTGDYFLLALLLGSYFVFTMACFLIPVYVIHNKIVEEKNRLAVTYCGALNNIIERLKTEFSEDEMKRFEFYKSIVAEVRSVPTWPLRLDTILKVFVTSILAPAVGILSTVLKVYKFGP